MNAFVSDTSTIDYENIEKNVFKYDYSKCTVVLKILFVENLCLKSAVVSADFIAAQVNHSIKECQLLFALAKR